MSAVSTRLHDDGGKLIVERTQDCESVLNSAADLRSAGLTGTSDMRHVGRIPAVVLEMWLNEAGLTMDQTDEVNALIKKKLMDGEFSKLRVWEGSW